MKKKIFATLILIAPLSLQNGVNAFKVKNLIFKTKKKDKNEIIVNVSVYHPDIRQTDSTPFETASMRIIDTIKLKSGKLKWVAISRNLLKRFGGNFSYGDSISLKKIGILSGKYMIADCMNQIYKNKIDILLPKEMGSNFYYKNVKMNW